MLRRVIASFAFGARSRAPPRPGRGDLPQLVNAADLLIYLHFTFALGARQWTDSTQGSASLAAGQPPPAAVADARVAARNCPGNGSGTVGRGAITPDPLVAGLTVARCLGFAKYLPRAFSAGQGTIAKGGCNLQHEVG